MPWLDVLSHSTKWQAAHTYTHTNLHAGIYFFLRAQQYQSTDKHTHWHNVFKVVIELTTVSLLFMKLPIISPKIYCTPDTFTTIVRGKFSFLSFFLSSPQGWKSVQPFPALKKEIRRSYVIELTIPICSICTDIDAIRHRWEKEQRGDSSSSDSCSCSPMNIFAMWNCLINMHWIRWRGMTGILWFVWGLRSSKL